MTLIKPYLKRQAKKRNQQFGLRMTEEKGKRENQDGGLIETKREESFMKRTDTSCRRQVRKTENSTLDLGTRMSLAFTWRLGPEI